MDGFYIAYLTGRSGVSTLIFVLKEGDLFGVDVAGMKYNGKIIPAGDSFTASLVYKIPAGVSLITGGPPASVETPVPLTFSLSSNFADGRTILIETPLGPVNARFEKVRDLL